MTKNSLKMYLLGSLLVYFTTSLSALPTEVIVRFELETNSKDITNKTDLNKSDVVVERKPGNDSKEGIQIHPRDFAVLRFKLSARNLPSICDPNGSPDAFAYIDEIGGYIVPYSSKTSIIPNEPNPDWPEEITVAYGDGWSDAIEIEVRDTHEDCDESIGLVFLLLDDITECKTYSYAISGGKGKILITVTAPCIPLHATTTHRSLPTTAQGTITTPAATTLTVTVTSATTGNPTSTDGKDGGEGIHSRWQSCLYMSLIILVFIV